MADLGLLNPAPAAGARVKTVPELLECHWVFWKGGEGYLNSTESVNLVLSAQYVYLAK
ncbi:MAG: hypothetical protein WAV28_18185 [Sedimentisphaerales bacterium]